MTNEYATQPDNRNNCLFGSLRAYKKEIINWPLKLHLTTHERISAEFLKQQRLVQLLGSIKSTFQL